MQPTASGPGAYRSTDTCVACGRMIDVKTAAYTGDGMICTDCEAGVMIREADVESARSSSIGAIGWGMLSLVCNPFLIPSVLAITGGVGELKTLAIYPPEQRTGKQLQAIFAIVLGAFWPTLIVGMVGLTMLSGAIGVLGGLNRSYDDDYGYDDPYDEPYQPPAYDDYDYGYEPYANDPGQAAPYPAPAYDDPPTAQELEELQRVLEEIQREQQLRE